MEKIPTIFERNPANMRKILNKEHPDCAWVFNGEGIATRKYDGTCCCFIEGVFYKRRQVKVNQTAPADFIQVQHDERTGKTFGWVPVDESGKADGPYREAREKYIGPLLDGTYELIGPKIQGNPEKVIFHVLLKHSDAEVFEDAPRTFEELKEWFKSKDIEGLVFHHPDGRMGKIKKIDFGFKRN